MAHNIQTLIDAETIAARVAELGAQIRADYAGKPLVAVCVLKGSVVFLADLVRHLDPTTQLEFLAVSSYEGTKSTGTVRINHDLRSDVTGAHLLIVEDIVDTGLTLAYLHKLLHARRPASVRIVTLLDKAARRQVDVPVDYVGFTIEDRFVVGYGLDLDEAYRTLPFVGEIVD
jgi:hypoxanthine phosphoribosyltransferase